MGQQVRGSDAIPDSQTYCSHCTLLFLPAVPCTLGPNPDLPEATSKEVAWGAQSASEVKHLMADFCGVGVKIRACAGALHPTIGVSLSVLPVGRKMGRKRENTESKVFMAKLPVTPGYSGFVPYLSCQGVYDEDNMSQCLQTFREITQGRKEQWRELHKAIAAVPPLKPICSEKTLLGVLHQYYQKYHPLSLESKNVKKPSCEPPIPGWAGYLPRARVTELGCSVRYTVMARNCYQDFMELIGRADRAHQKPYEEIYGVKSKQEPPVQSPRVLPQDDRLPDYPDFSVPSRSVFPLGRTPREICQTGEDGFVLRPNVSCSQIRLDPLALPKSTESVASPAEATLREACNRAPAPLKTSTSTREVP
ncbi:uncharacterized protein C10orf82 homolog [Suncus etruscus]|uniref:uncharacterized protein C10orf82 homolog n=1 Tax=Suncus etruscus TaxID=109475 RepID=UPI002110DE5C|nr:uncharacterized protein C10orf82 homolog [Suncus etruscus]